jgi:hypothetical protein
MLKKWERDIERGQLAQPGEETFLSAAVSYMKAGGERRPMQPLLDHFAATPLRLIDQAAIDAAAVALMPDATSATRNREVYTPVSAVLKRAGVEFQIKRPKGWRGKILRKWLWPEQAFGIFEAARSFDPEFAVFIEGLCYRVCGCRSGWPCTATTCGYPKPLRSCRIVRMATPSRSIYLPF